MRVLWLSHNVPYPPRGGVLQRNYHLVREIGRRAELHLVALRQQALCPSERDLVTARSALSEFCESCTVFSIDWEKSFGRRAVQGLQILLAREAYDTCRFYSRDCHRYLSRLPINDFDIVHVDTIGLLQYLRWFTRNTVVLNHHNIESAMLLRRARHRGGLLGQLFRWQAQRLRALEETWAPRVDQNFVVSGVDGTRLDEIAPGCRITVVPNGVDTRYFDRPVNDDPDNSTLVFVGGQSWYPNRDAIEYFLLEIWQRIVQALPRVRLVVIGREPCPLVVSMAGKDDRISVLGFVEDLRDEVARAAVYLCPFREGGGTRLKVLDGMAMRKAIVATSLAVEGLPMQPDQHFLLGDTAETFAQQVLQLLRTPGLRRHLGEKCRLLVEESFDWVGIGQRMFESYQAERVCRVAVNLPTT